MPVRVLLYVNCLHEVVMFGRIFGHRNNCLSGEHHAFGLALGLLPALEATAGTAGSSSSDQMNRVSARHCLRTCKENRDLSSCKIRSRSDALGCRCGVPGTARIILSPPGQRPSNCRPGSGSRAGTWSVATANGQDGTWLCTTKLYAARAYWVLRRGAAVRTLRAGEDARRLRKLRFPCSRRLLSCWLRRGSRRVCGEMRARDARGTRETNWRQSRGCKHCFASSGSERHPRCDS
jgi:hypothetical protein